MDLKDISTQLLYTTVPIWVTRANGTVSSGTAFIYNCPVPGQDNSFIPLLITNHHVVKDGTHGQFELFERRGDDPTKERLRVGVQADMLEKHADPQLDLAAIPLGPVLNQLETAGKPVFFRSVGPELIPDSETFENLAALEDIVFIGYPSGLRDQQSGMPIIRRGITATPVWNNFDNTPSFLVDAGVFPGSSGSPVFIMNQGGYASKGGVILGSRLMFLGVITESMLRVEGSEKAYLGLGRVVNSHALREFVDKIVKKIHLPTA